MVDQGLNPGTKSMANASRRHGWWPGILLVGFFLILTAGPVLSGVDRLPSKSIDMDRNHVPVIRAFASEWPAVDVSDYDSATTPGMHLLLALMASLFGDSETLLQSMSVLFGGLLVGVAWWFAARSVDGITAALCILPLALSPYVLGNAIWVMTDDLALALVAITVGVAVFLPPGGVSSAGSGLALVFGVLVRQINIWVCAVAWIATLLPWSKVRRHLPFRDRLDLEGRPFAAASIFSLAILAAVGILIGFVLLWGGLVPPRFQPGGTGAAQHAGGLQTAVLPYVLTLLGIYGIAVLPGFLQAWIDDPLVRRSSLLGLAIGLLAGLLLPSVPGLEHGRNGGWLWSLAASAPVFFDRSLVLISGSILGGLVAGTFVGLLIRGGRARAALLLVGFSISFVAAYTANVQAFQRYFDPPVLLLLGWAAALTVGSRTDAGVISRTRVVFVVGVAAFMQAVFAIATIYLPLIRFAASG